MTEKEALVVEWVVVAFHYYLWGNPFRLITDHAPLKWLQVMKNTNSRIMRWYLALQPYNFTISQS